VKASKSQGGSQPANPGGSTPTTLTVAEDDSGQRLDKVLAARIPDLSRARLQAIIRAGLVSGPEGRTIKDGAQRVKSGEAFTVLIP
jgi:23S rRNA pseudouridine1911/1915/1917 synthase